MPPTVFHCLQLYSTPTRVDWHGSESWPELFLSGILWSSTHDIVSTLVSRVVYHLIKHPSWCFFTPSTPSNKISQFHWTFFLGLCKCGTDTLIAMMDHLLDMIAQRELGMFFSYTLGREYRMMRNRYSRLLFTSGDRLCANLRVREQSTNMTSQC